MAASASAAGSTATAVAPATSTFPRLLAGLAVSRPSDTAMQEKRYGIWMPLTWAQYAERVRDFAHGLASMGIERGDIVAVLGDNRPEWLIAELAAQSIGAAVVGIYPTSIGEELLHILTLARIRVVVAEDQEQVDKLLKLRADQAAAPSTDMPPLLVETVVFYDPHGLEQYVDPVLKDFTDVEAAGREWGAQRPGWYDAQVALGQPGDTAVVCTTSGTTSRPKLAELSHTNLLAMAEHLTAIDPIAAKDRYVSFLPFAWIGEQMLAVACGLSRGLTLSFPEDSATQKTDLREIGPDVMFSPPRIWESMLSEVQVRIDEAGWLKRKVFGWGYAIGDRVAEHKIHGRGTGGLAVVHWVADQVALRPVRDQLGLARIQHCYTGGAPLGPDVFRFASRIVADVVSDLAAAAAIPVDAIDLVIPHQANGRILATAAKHLGLPSERLYDCVADFGNTSSASIPLALDHAIQAGRVRPGDRIALVGYGGGLSWGGCLIEWTATGDSTPLISGGDASTDALAGSQLPERNER